ncbi:hypothetical protein CI109_105614 [Kwoniella shandongensis]|uniref:Uncharacterized protein n=1 Tax=Kwoniella shandongensis TaxID=1734106 RepID=A0A5M6C2Q6_9TREE|nr:uncharacterized protein CI109_002330 [Kwoniella shandongensis]KAA5529437.1 hypothetical protein CI109_002330 [Kwoniella shandongensis]
MLSTITPDPSPALTHRSVNSNNGRSSESGSGPTLEYDLSLSTAVTHLVQHLIQPLSPHYPHSTLLKLRDSLRTKLVELFEPTWEEQHPQLGSGFRSLICTKYLGLPPILKDVAGEFALDEGVWKKAIAATREREHKVEEWEAWCDPGQVVWRWGGWEWEDVGFEPFKVIRENFHIVWQAAATSHLSPPTTAPTTQPLLTPARASHAIPIRAPTVFAIPPTPAAPSPATVSTHDIHESSSSDLLPAFASLGLGHAPGGPGNRQPSGWSSSDAASSRSTSVSESEHSRSVSGLSVDSVDHQHDHDHNDEHDIHSKSPSRASHRGSESLSSVASSVSDSNSGHSQLLTPGSRPGSADPFGAALLSLPMKGHEASRERDVRSRKITPPMLSLPRGRTPSPGTPDGQSITPNTDNTITPSPSAPTPTVTPYDGGNVTVLGGGVKLGGSASRTTSVHSGSRTPVDRSRSPSISLASRALSSALGPNSNGEGTATTISGGGGQRKQRTRRRIMPTYLGHLGQPGVGGPIMGVFGQFAGKPSQSPPSNAFGGYGHVGVGVAPPPITSMRSVSMPRMG